MKAYRIELLVIDFDRLGADGVRSAIENTRYANDCISPSVVTVDERDIGKWSDDNPLNNRNTAAAEFRRLFAAPAAGAEKDAERLLAAIVRSDVGIATRHKLEDGQGTATEDGKNWLAAIEFVAAAHTKARDGA